VKAEDVQLVQLLDGAKQFIVPVFQRDYSWETKHCLQLWKDIMQAGSTENIKAHFVGSIVYIAADDSRLSYHTNPNPSVIVNRDRVEDFLSGRLGMRAMTNRS
jgi:hypothetical protein